MPADIPTVTVAGDGSAGAPNNNGDGGPAASASVQPNSMAIGADGSLYIADQGGCVRRVTPDSIIRTFAGQCFNSGFSGDGGPATSAQLSLPMDLAIGPDGSLYIADTDDQRIRRVDPGGTITTVAGSGPTATGGFSGDGGPAVQANATALTWTTTSPVGRQSTTTIDAAGRTTQIAVPSVAPFHFTYDARGRLSTTTQGSHTWTQAYDTKGYLGSVTDPLSHLGRRSARIERLGRPRGVTLTPPRFLTRVEA